MEEDARPGGGDLKFLSLMVEAFSRTLCGTVVVVGVSTEEDDDDTAAGDDDDVDDDLVLSFLDSVFGVVSADVLLVVVVVEQNLEKLH